MEALSILLQSMISAHFNKAQASFSRLLKLDLEPNESSLIFVFDAFILPCTLDTDSSGKVCFKMDLNNETLTVISADSVDYTYEAGFTETLLGFPTSQKLMNKSCLRFYKN